MTDARIWIGPAGAGDRLDLATVLAAIQPDANTLRDSLQTDRIKGLFRMRSEASQLAAEAQTRFKRLSTVAVVGTAVATLTSGLLLYGAGSEAGNAAPVEGLVHWVTKNKHAVLALQIAALFFSGAVASLLASQNYSERWQEQRNRAELLRRQIFDDILAMAKAQVPSPLASADPGNAIAQAFEFFRRYQHEVQIAFYAKASTRHGRATLWLAWLTALLAGFAAVTGALGGFGGAALVVSAFLGISVPIVMSAAQSWRVANRDSDKLVAYQKAKEALDTNLLDIDTVRARAALGDADAVEAYVTSVHQIIATENEVWRPAQRP